jgi:uncharacterized protein
MDELGLTRLIFHSLKSVQGIEVSSAHTSERGLEHDRRFMIVDPDGNLVTARQSPKLLSVSSRIESAQLLMSANGSA